MSIQALLNVNQIAARKGASELEFAVKKVHNLDASKGGPDGYLKAIVRRVEGIVIDEIRKFYPEDNFLGAESGSEVNNCLLYTSPSPRDMRRSRMPSSA